MRGLLREITMPVRSALKHHGIMGLVIIGIAFTTMPLARSQDQDLDAYKWRGKAYWWFSQPTGNISGKGEPNSFDFQKDFGFGSYSTFTGSLDWHFKRKHHFLFSASPVSSSKSATLSRTITFQGVTYDVGTRTSADLRSLSFAPGYQYDFIRRNHGYLAGAATINLLDTKATLSGSATVNGMTATQSSSGSVFAPLPVLGPRARWYPLRDSNRLALDGDFEGMYFFGYGDFYSAHGAIGFGLTSRLKLAAGYVLGSRLTIHGGSDRIGTRFTQKGPIVGLEGSW